MPGTIQTENTGVQCFAKGVLKLRIPSIEKKFLCRSCCR